MVAYYPEIVSEAHNFDAIFLMENMFLMGLFVFAQLCVVVRGFLLDNSLSVKEIHLDKNSGFALEFNLVDNDHIQFKFTINAAHADWFGFGFSETGHMLGADMVVVSFPPVTGGLLQLPRVRDMFVPWDAFPNISPKPEDDLCNDWKLLSHREIAKHGKREVILTRKLDTKDKQDRVIEPKTLAIYAYGRGEFGFHGPNRGSLAINFYGSTSNSHAALPQTKDVHLEIKNYPLLPQHTSYVVQKFDVGEQECWAVAYRALPKQLALVHHFLVHDCGNDNTKWPLTGLEFGVPKLYDDSPMGSGACQSVVVAWAKGGGLETFYFPNNTGYQLGHRAGRYLIVEMHLDNPELLSGVKVTGGVTLKTTKHAPQYNVGCLVLGDPAVRFPTIPALRAKTTIESHCPAACTKTFAGDIQVFQTMTHMHNYGREQWTVKNGKEVLTSKQFWNFAFQTTDQQREPFTLRPGDSLNTFCTYDTSKSKSAVPFGFSSSEEMCMNFFFYYPKENAGFTCGYFDPTTNLCKRAKHPNWNGNAISRREQFPEQKSKGDKPTSKRYCASKDSSKWPHFLRGNDYLIGEAGASGDSYVLLLVPLAFAALMVSFWLRRWFSK